MINKYELLPGLLEHLFTVIFMKDGTKLGYKTIARLKFMSDPKD